MTKILAIFFVPFGIIQATIGLMAVWSPTFAQRFFHGNWSLFPEKLAPIAWLAMGLANAIMWASLL